MSEVLVKLVGLKADGSLARVAEEVIVFESECEQFSIDAEDQDNVFLTTRNGTYDLHPTKADNQWSGRFKDGTKMLFTRKKIVANLRYWTKD